MSRTFINECSLECTISIYSIDAIHLGKSNKLVVWHTRKIEINASATLLEHIESADSIDTLWNVTSVDFNR